MTGYMEKRALIIALMTEQHLSLNALAAKMGLLPDYLAARLSARGPLTGTELQRFADALDVPVAKLGCAEPAVSR